MKIFIWKYLREMTENYHDGAGLVVFASNIQRCEELHPQTSGIVPDYVLDIQSHIPEQSIIFPDAGCC